MERDTLNRVLAESQNRIIGKKKNVQVIITIKIDGRQITADASLFWGR
jgi:hypothetical protein